MLVNKLYIIPVTRVSFFETINNQRFVMGVAMIRAVVAPLAGVRRGIPVSQGSFHQDQGKHDSNKGGLGAV